MNKTSPNSNFSQMFIKDENKDHSLFINNSEFHQTPDGKYWHYNDGIWTEDKKSKLHCYTADGRKWIYDNEQWKEIIL